MSGNADRNSRLKSVVHLKKNYTGKQRSSFVDVLLFLLLLFYFVVVGRAGLGVTVIKIVHFV